MDPIAHALEATTMPTTTDTDAYSWTERLRRELALYLLEEGEAAMAQERRRGRLRRLLAEGPAEYCE